MSIFTKFWDALQKAFPFLASAAERTFNELEDAAKHAGINGSLFAQIIKENSHAAVEDVRNLIKAKLKMTEAQLSELETDIAAQYNIPTPETTIKILQMRLNSATSGLLHNSAVNEISTIASLVLSKGKLTWLTLFMGVGEYIYRKFVKGVDVVIEPRTGQCLDPKPTTHPTPNGEWVCKNGSWQWLEAIG